tara:strand:+ start:2358 stop:2792 length:435 start_codon:yes stop_codon:yes gene_type:complete
MKYAIIDGTTVKNTGTIQQLFPNTSFSGSGPNSSFIADNNLVELVETLSFTLPTQKMSSVEPYLNNGKAYNVKVEPTTTEEQTALTNSQWESIRDQRDNLLKQTDWRASSDLTLSDEWKTYRQSLRDITTQSDPYNITWPIIPS